MNFTGKRIGIWGFGATGKSFLSFFSQQKALIDVLDERILDDKDQQLINQVGGRIHKPDNIVPFLQNNEIIVPSPGINIRDYLHLVHTHVAEIDLFMDYFRKPIIAVTGSWGKTSIVTLLHQLLTAHGARIALGGNVGLPMLNILERNDIDGAVLELSSFQLEWSTRCAPDLAIWTNLSANHLDRHATLANYFAAKANMFVYQRPGQRALLPLALYDMLTNSLQQRPGYAFFSLRPPTQQEYARINNQQSLYFLDGNSLMLWKNGQTTLLFSTPVFTRITFPDNWLIISAALHMLGIPLNIIDTAALQLKVPEHRLEYVDTVAGVAFYNDSKSTVPAAALAAVQKLQPSPIILLLGGLSKGIDRSDLIKRLVGKVRFIVCFGAEAQQLAAWCTQYGIANSSHTKLEDAFAMCIRIAHKGDSILLSPAGASYDLFDDYVQRGAVFKSLVAAHART